MLTCGTIHAGTAPNIIPDSVTVEGTLRTFDEGVRQFCLKRAKEIVSSVAEAFRAEGRFEVLGGCVPLCVDEDLQKNVFA